MAIQIKSCVRFKIIPVEMLAMFTAILNAAEAQGVEPVITGAAYNGYPPGKVHDAGYAIDVRTSNIPDPQSFAESVDRYLRVVDSHYVVLYGDPKHRDHIHIGFSWWFSHDEQRRRKDGTG